MTKTFHIIKPGSRAIWIMKIICIITFIISLLPLIVLYPMGTIIYKISGEGLLIERTIYGRFIPKDRTLIERIKIINLNTDDGYTPVWRTNGIGLPDYQEGWFDLKNGEKALLFLTDHSGVIYIPTKDGYSILLNTNQPQEFLKAIKNPSDTVVFTDTRKPMWSLRLIALLIFIILLSINIMLLIIVKGMKSARVELSDEGLRIKGSLYKRFIKKTSIISDGAKIVNLKTDEAYKAWFKSNGVGLPGYLEGWFWLNNNDKALMIVTDKEKVVYIPTGEKFSILLSPDNPEELLEEIRKIST